jgi:hypothetical protein
MTRNKKAALVFMMLFAAATLSLLLSRRTPVPADRASESSAIRSESVQSAEPRGDATAPDQAEVLEEQVERQKESIFLKVMEREQVPLDFYGRVVDEAKQGVAGAKVRVSASEFNLLKPEDMFLGAKKLTLETDSEGNFSVRGLRGYSLVIRVEKEGYFTSSRNPSGFNYVGDPKENFRSHPSHPVIFQLQKKGAVEALIHTRGKGYVIPRDGTPVFVDLFESKTNSAFADLKVQAWTDEGNKDKNYRYDWQVRIEVIDGGIQERIGEFAYLAPESGYATSYELNYPTSLGNAWSDDVAKSFFLQLRGGQTYGRLDFRMIAHGDHFCRLQAWLNPSGSRNLEPDPSLLFPNMDAYNRYLAKQKQTSAKP